jgi:NifU-like protein involved in Fe-S cluster formation
VNAPLYTIEILRLAAALPDVRTLDREDGRAELRSPTCGSKMTVGVELDSDRQVKALALQVEACAFGQASAALMAQGAEGRGRERVAAAMSELSNWLNGDADDPGDWPGLSALTPARSRKSRHGAILLSFRTLLAAMDEALK